MTDPEKHATGVDPEAPPRGGEAGSPPAPGAAVDRAALLDRLGGDETILVEIVKIFLEDTPRLLEAIDAANAAGDAKTLRRLAHTLKGSAGTVGAAALQASALALEQTVDGGDDLAAAARLIPGVRAHFLAVQGVMTTWERGEEVA